MKHIIKYLALLFLGLASMLSYGQQVSIKSNLLHDATATVNLGFEFVLDRNLSLDISGGYNPWTFSKHKKWKHWIVQPELRFWLKERRWKRERFSGHFFGANLLGGQFNFNNVKLIFNMCPKLKDYNYQGNFIGGGLSYGYQWILGKRIGVEATLGIGYSYLRYNKYSCPVCGTDFGSFNYHYGGLTKAGITFIYFIQ